MPLTSEMKHYFYRGIGKWRDDIYVYIMDTTTRKYVVLYLQSENSRKYKGFGHLSATK